MAKNFNQKAMLENNNVAVEAKASTGGKVFLYILLSLPVFLGWIWYITKRNWFKATKENLIEQLSNIDGKLTERYNVLSNQLKVAQKALGHEKGLQSEITAARAAVVKPQPFDAEKIAEKNNVVSGLTSRFNMVQENYPEIAAMPIMEKLNDSVKDLESELAAHRRFYSSAARKYNSALVNYPLNVVADGLDIQRFPMFEADDHKRANVSLDFA